MRKHFVLRRNMMELSLDLMLHKFDMDICKCWYDSDGTFHSTYAAEAANKTNTMHITNRTTLDRILKYRARGFKIIVNDPSLISDHAKYCPEFERELIEDPSIRTLCFRHMVITKDLVDRLRVRHWHRWSFGGCIIQTSLLERPIYYSFSRCVFDNITVSGRGFRSNCVHIPIFQDCEGCIGISLYPGQGLENIMDTCKYNPCLEIYIHGISQ